MEILTDKTFWIIIGAIILLMAIVGYLADGMELTKKSREKPKKEKKKTKEEKEEIPLVNSDYPIEILKTDETPNAWTGNIETEDKNETKIYDTAGSDDWQGLPPLETDQNEYSVAPLEDNVVENYNELPNQSTIVPQEEIIQNKEEKNYNNDNQNENIWR